MSKSPLNEQVIYDAAMSLAKLVAIHKKPILLDIDKYTELLIGGHQINPLIQAWINEEHDNAPTKQDVGLEMQKRRDYQHLQSHLVNEINDAFTDEDVHAIAACTLTEIGGTDEYPSLGECNVFCVFPVPSEAEAFVMVL